MKIKPPHYTKRHHHYIVGVGICLCAFVAICWPDWSYVAQGLSVMTNLVWLLEPAA